jgi:hypothetical protein
MANWIFNSQIKEAVGIEDDYTAQDALITQINNSTTKTLENLLGRSLTRATYVEYIDSKANAFSYHDVFGTSDSGYGSAYKQIKYHLKNFPVIDSEDFTIEYRPSFLIDGQEDILAESEYSLDTENGIFIIEGRGTANYPRGLKVTYTAGFEATTDGDSALSATLPADLVQAAVWQSMHTYEKYRLSNVNVRESRGQGSSNTTRYVNINAIAPEAMAIIVQNKRRFFKIV